MNEILINVISCVVTGVIIPLSSLLGVKLVKWINTKISNDTLSNNLSKATEIVVNSIKCIFQTYVDSLKKTNSFDKEAQVTAFNKAKEIAFNQMSDDLIQYISKTFGDIDTWLTTKIEAEINSLKSQYPKSS